MLEIKNTVREMKNTFDGLISRLKTAKEIISKLEDRLIELFKLKCKEKKEWRKKNIRKEHTKIVGEFQMVQRYIYIWKDSRKRKSRTKKYSIMAKS